MLLDIVFKLVENPFAYFIKEYSGIITGWRGILSAHYDAFTGDFFFCIGQADADRKLGQGLYIPIDVAICPAGTDVLSLRYKINVF